MACKSLKKARFADIKKQWAATLRFLYCCSKFDNDYMATIFKKAMTRPITKWKGVVPIGIHQITYEYEVRFYFQRIRIFSLF
jgi:hypothetical protein